MQSSEPALVSDLKAKQISTKAATASSKPKAARPKAATARKTTTAAVVSPTAAFEAALAEARGRRNIKLFNALMARHARFGELERVEQAFDALSGLHPPLAPNEYTYGIMLNAFTRSGVVER